ncbi:MAG: type II toxin-antitoxin system ParD family antitoxin [Thiopseudomonas sp.]|nr:type II toxin-antitoxin system ParD family antitoxin [Thiopseudomonas sp.]MCK9464627.1 type II toxin-antitoxin system ParD family antitoxin [Thiopseudomonas sp.]
MPTRNVVITDHQAELIEQLVASGEYQNASEVLREGLRLVEERRALYEAKLDNLRFAVQQGVDSAVTGDYENFASAEQLADHMREEATRIIQQVEQEQEQAWA